VSGGHTFLAYMPSKFDIQLLGETRDDSVGEAYDKVGRMLGLDFPAGPIVDRLAKSGESTIPFPRPLINQALEFSFSGLKSAVARYLSSIETPNVPNVCASFVDAVMEILIVKCKRALKKYPCKSLVIVGGVAASPQLRENAQAICDERSIKLCLPPLKWSTDNAAMIGLATWDYIDKDIYTTPTPISRLPLTEF